MTALYAGVNGYLDDIPTDQVSALPGGAPRAAAHRGRRSCRTIRETGDLDDETAEKLNAAIERFKGMFNVGRRQAA